ncbi:MAG TPA: Tol-Pal system protein TolB, partial [Lysobacter sp.]|nr:Tol-Pal system protein TolB [Lysobacter sp.]
MTRLLRRLALVLLVLPLANFAQEPPQIDVIGGQAAALPIAVVPFAGSAGDTDIGKVIAADLDRSGQFRTLPERDLVERPTRGSEVSYPTWRTLKQDFLLIGRVLPEGSQLRVEYELFDVAKQTRILGEAKIAPGAAARDVAHQIADAVYEKVLGVRGAFWTRIAYVTASGTGANRHYALMVADSDGFNAQSVVS